MSTNRSYLVKSSKGIKIPQEEAPIRDIVAEILSSLEMNVFSMTIATVRTCIISSFCHADCAKLYSGFNLPWLGLDYCISRRKTA